MIEAISEWAPVVAIGVLIIAGIIALIRYLNPNISQTARGGLEAYVEPIIPRDDVFYRRAVDSIPATDRTIHHLRSPLAAGMVEQWNQAKQALTPLTAGGSSARATGPMRAARRIDRMSRRVAVLAAAENGDEDARLAIVDDLLEDLAFAYDTCSLDNEKRVPIRDGIAAVTRRARALKADLTSPQFFQVFLGICAEYAAVMRDARPIFKYIKKDIDYSPPDFGSELWVFGAGIDGLVPWLQAYAVNEQIEFRNRSSSS